MTADEQHPIACTLSGEARQDRRAWIATLVRDALRGSERDDLTLHLRFAPEAVQRVQDMVRMEQACCGFLSFEMDTRPQEIWLTISAPEAARSAADAFFAPFTTSAAPLARPAGIVRRAPSISSSSVRPACSAAWARFARNRSVSNRQGSGPFIVTLCRAIWRESTATRKLPDRVGGYRRTLRCGEVKDGCIRTTA